MLSIAVRCVLVGLFVEGRELAIKASQWLKWLLPSVKSPAAASLTELRQPLRQLGDDALAGRIFPRLAVSYECRGRRVLIPRYCESRQN